MASAFDAMLNGRDDAEMVSNVPFAQSYREHKEEAPRPTASDALKPIQNNNDNDNKSNNDKNNNNNNNNDNKKNNNNNNSNNNITTTITSAVAPSIPISQPISTPREAVLCISSMRVQLSKELFTLLKTNKAKVRLQVTVSGGERRSSSSITTAVPGVVEFLDPFHVPLEFPKRLCTFTLFAKPLAEDKHARTSSSSKLGALANRMVNATQIELLPVAASAEIALSAILGSNGKVLLEMFCISNNNNSNNNNNNNNNNNTNSNPTTPKGSSTDSPRMRRTRSKTDLVKDLIGVSSPHDSDGRTKKEILKDLIGEQHYCQSVLFCCS
jgi:hypothetical protein